MILSSLFTNTKKLLSKLFRTQSKIDVGYRDMGRKFALEYLEDLRHAITTQSFPNHYTPLTETWVARKEPAHKTDMFIDTGDLLAEIMGITPVVRESSPFFTEYVVIFPSAAKVTGLNNLRPLFTDLYNKQLGSMRVRGKFFIQDIIDKEWNAK